ncbi:hypothetical protein ACE6H2_017280 [Prunus campanulata]
MGSLHISLRSNIKVVINESAGYGDPPVDPRRLKISAAKPYCYNAIQHVGKAADSGHHVYFAQPVAL